MYNVKITLKPELRKVGIYTFTLKGVETTCDTRKVEFTALSMDEALRWVKLDELTAIKIKKQK